MPNEPATPSTATTRSRPTRNHRLIASQLPSWLSGAPLDQRQAFAASLKRGQTSRTALAKHLTGFKSVTEFAAPLLSQALLEHYGPGLDIYQDKLKHVHILAAETLSTPYQDKVVTQSLLQAALQNFESGETGYWGFDRGSAILRTTTTTLKKDLIPRDFAKLVRELDLGGRYAKHIEAYLPSPAPYRAFFEQQQRDELALQTDIARMQGRLDPAAYQMLQSLLDPAQTPSWDKRPITCNYVNLLDFPNFGYSGALLKGVLLIERQPPSGSSDAPCVLYLSSDAQQAVKQYVSRQAVHDDLRERLRYKAYQVFFKRYVHVRSQTAFFQALASSLSDLNSTGRIKVVANTDLQMKLTSLGDNPLDLFCTLQTVMRLDDARVTAVPTGDEDGTLLVVNSDPRWARVSNQPVETLDNLEEAVKGALAQPVAENPQP